MTMHTWDVVLITEDRYVQPPVIDGYIAQILEDDALLSEALQQFGLTVTRVSWSDQYFDWSTTRCAVFRTTWDYFHRFQAFTTWLADTEQKTRLINDPATIRWNMDKHYLLDLQKWNIPIVDTTIIEPGENITLHTLMQESGFAEAIIKPAVSGAARHTYRVQAGHTDALEPVWAELLQQETMLFQPFQQHIVDNGEISCMLMGGKFTHAVLKKAKAGDFRVQDDHGGTVHAYTASAEEIAFAEKAVAACSTLPAYARVDITRNDTGALVIMELELIEPELWFRKFPPASHILAQHLYNLLTT